MPVDIVFVLLLSGTRVSSSLSSYRTWLHTTFSLGKKGTNSICTRGLQIFIYPLCLMRWSVLNGSLSNKIYPVVSCPGSKLVSYHLTFTRKRWFPTSLNRECLLCSPFITPFRFCPSNLIGNGFPSSSLVIRLTVPLLSHKQRIKLRGWETKHSEFFSEAEIYISVAELDFFFFFHFTAYLC